MSADGNIFENDKCLLSENQNESVFHLTPGDFRPFPQRPRTRYESEPVIQVKQDTVEIELASQFYAWLGSLNATESTEEDQEEIELADNFSYQEAYCQSIITKTDEILSKVAELKEKYQSVSDKTNNLHETCESILCQQNNLSDKATKIDEYLKYFTILNSIEAKLSSRNVVISADRIEPMLAAIDSSISFLEKHKEFKDTTAYLTRLSVCLDSALVIVKDGVKNAIRQVVMEIAELGDAITPENSFILLYGRFRSQASRIRSLMELLESRENVSVRYREAMTDCQAYYIAKREALVIPVAQASIGDLTKKYSREHGELFRTTISFILHMCDDETSLFQRFFMPQESAVEYSATFQLPQAFESMLTSLCRCVYDALRPFLIHVSHIEILTELCDLLLHEFLSEHNNTHQEVVTEVFEDVCRTLLADVQQRLIYRAHVYLKSQIQDYEPSDGDLAYPEKLKMIEQITSSLQAATSSATDGETSADAEEKSANAAPNAPRNKVSTSSTDFHGMWYPTVRRTLVCISSLSRCLDMDAFQGLAQNCLAACITSLLRAQQRIELRQTPIDGQLFLVKYLLILREQVTPFSVEFRVKETSLDFSSIKNAAYEALPKMGSKLFDFTRANTLLRRLLEGPTVTDTNVDSRRQLDHQLKVACEAFIGYSVVILTGGISALLEKTKLPSDASKVSPLGSHEAVKDVVSSALRLLAGASQASSTQPNLAAIRQKLMLYLGNPSTVAIIMRPVENAVVGIWRQLATRVNEHYTPEERMVIACPTDNQIRMFFHS